MLKDLKAEPESDIGAYQPHVASFTKTFTSMRHAIHLPEILLPLTRINREHARLMRSRSILVAVPVFEPPG